MFSADLSWTDDTVEKVGDRKGRKHKERENSISSSNSSNLTNNPARQQSSRKGSISKPSFASVKGSFRRPSISNERRKRTPLPVDPSTPFKDPTQQPDWTLSAKISPKLPSGAPLEPPPPFSAHEIGRPIPVVPKGRILYSRQTNITRETVDDAAHRAWSVRNPSEAENICQSYEQVKHEILALQSKPEMIVTETQLQSDPPQTEYAPSELDAEENQITITPPEKNPRRYGNYGNHDAFLLPATPVEPIRELPALFQGMAVDAPSESDYPPPPPPKKDRGTKTPSNISRWQAPSSWDIVHSSKSPPKRSASASSPASSPPGEDRRAAESSHFQRFVRRMEGAGPRIILERLKEEWDEPTDRAMSDELQLEKHLWALTALQLQALDRFARPSQSPAPSGPLPPISLNKRRKILELDGNLGEVYQLSAIYPNSKIAHLTSAPPGQGSSIPLPAQAIHHPLNSSTGSKSSSSVSGGAGLLPLPYANSSMHHIRSSRMASLLPASQLPALLAECYRILKPGGVLELRLMDATPERGSMGPQMATWLEERLLIGLEREFRCQRPVTMLPRWASEAGFIPLPFRNEMDAQGLRASRDSLGKMGMARCLMLPAAAQERDQGTRDVVAQVGVLVGRALWKDAWGPFVDEDYAENWWWDNPDVVEECREWKTVWDVGTLYVVKEDRA